MRRTPIVLAGTVVGLAGVLGFHTSPAKLTLGTVPSSTVTGRSTTTSAAPTTSTSAAGTNPPTTNATTAANSNPTTTVAKATPTTVRQTTTTAAPTTTAPPTTRTATGPLVNYYFGTLSVSVTATGKKITKVTISSLSDGGNFRSQSIDQQSIPMLEQQALAVQSAQIQGVSGASYTSAGFAQSLQGALKQLGV